MTPIVDDKCRSTFGIDRFVIDFLLNRVFDFPLYSPFHFLNKLMPKYLVPVFKVLPNNNKI